MTNRAAIYVFISYSHDDASFAESFSTRLHRAGTPHFRDTEVIEWGENIPARVHAALEKATHLVVLISPGSEQSQWVAYEMGYARGHDVTLVPYLLHPRMKVPGFLANIRYLQTKADEKKFITSLKKQQRRKAAPSVQRSSPLAMEEPTLESKLKSPNGNTRRQAVIEMGESRDRGYVSMLRNLLDTEENENVRESVIKSLGKLGGEEATSILESVWFGKEKSRFGKAAARNALKELGLWEGKKPILNPSAIRNIFISLRAHRAEQDTKRDREKQELLDEIRGKMRAIILDAGYSLSQIEDLGTSLKSEFFTLLWNVSKLQQQWYYRIHYSMEIKDIKVTNSLMPWSPTSSDEIIITTHDTLGIESAAKRARREGLTIDLILENRIRVIGSQWPGRIDYEFLTLSLDLMKTQCGTTIIVDGIPYDVCDNWLSCIRLIIRLSRWLGMNK